MKSSRSGVTAEFSAKASIRKDGRINLYGPGWLVQVNRESNPTLFAHLEATILPHSGRHSAGLKPRLKSVASHKPWITLPL
jgi:hypothetical protein